MWELSGWKKQETVQTPGPMLRPVPGHSASTWKDPLPCPCPTLPPTLTPATKRTDNKVNRNFKLTKSDNYLFCLVPSTSHTKVSIKAENHQPETDRCGTFWLNTRPKVSHIELIYGPMQSIIGILSSVFSILWGALASATASRKKRCLSAEIRGWLDNGPLWPALVGSSHQCALLTHF